MTAIVGFCTGKSVYAEALVVTAIEENIVLIIPCTALVRAVALVSPGHELGLGVLLGLSCTVIDALDITEHARSARSHRGAGRSTARWRSRVCRSAPSLRVVRLTVRRAGGGGYGGRGLCRW